MKQSYTKLLPRNRALHGHLHLFNRKDIQFQFNSSIPNIFITKRVIGIPKFCRVGFCSNTFDAQVVCNSRSEHISRHRVLLFETRTDAWTTSFFFFGASLFFPLHHFSAHHDLIITSSHHQGGWVPMPSLTIDNHSGLWSAGKLDGVVSKSELCCLNHRVIRHWWTVISVLLLDSFRILYCILLS